MFLSTFGIGEKTVYEWLKNTKDEMQEKKERNLRQPTKNQKEKRKCLREY